MYIAVRNVYSLYIAIHVKKKEYILFIAKHLKKTGKEKRKKMYTVCVALHLNTYIYIKKEVGGG